jgi:uncharacterized protein (TIGR03083 family)
VDLRRPLPPAAVLAELASVLDRRLRQLREMAADGADPEVDTLFWGRQPLSRSMRTRVFDAWAHEQDVRRATGRQGGLDSPAAQVTCAFLTRVLPTVVHRAGLPDGTTVRFDVAGEQEIHETVGDGPPQVSVSTDWDTFVRLACGRVEPGLAKVDGTGNPEQVRLVLAALAITP